MSDAGLRRGLGEVSGRLAIDAVIDLRARTAARDPGQMDDRIDAFKKWTPIDRSREIGVLHDFDVVAEIRRR